MNQEKINEIEKLIKQIESYDKTYWEEGNYEITDPEYDKLIEKLKQIDPDNILINRSNTPKVKSEGKIKHEHPMLSLDKVYTIDELLDWADSIKRSNDEIYTLGNKYDGWSVELNHSILSTKGDSFEGDIINNKKIYVKNINNNPLNDDCYIHGELLMLKSDFKKYKSKILRDNGKEYKTSRSILTGLLGKDEINYNYKQVLTLVPFEHLQILLKFSELKTLDWDKIIFERQNCDFPLDGLVLKLYDEEYGNSLGYTSHHPKSAMAFKFSNPTGKTVLRDILWSVGKNKITPVGIVDPVQVGGVIVDSPNLHNYSYILKKDIHIGDTLIIERCGDVIPDVQKVIPGENRKEIKLENCPVCGEKVYFNDIELFCTNKSCIGTDSRKLIDSIIRVGIEGIGLPTIIKLITTHNCRTLVDLFSLKYEDFLQLEGFAETSANNIYTEINRIKIEGIYEWQILSSLNINGIGDSLSKEVISKFSISELFEKKPDDLLEINNIGKERAYEICKCLKNSKEYINILMNIIHIKDNVNITNENKTVCFTGKMENPRKYYQELAKNKGYKPLDDVSTKLDLLVCNDILSNSGKVKKAKKFNIKIISLDEFLKL